MVDVSAGSSFGSGCLLSERLVLTARHVVCADDGTPYPDPRVRFLDDAEPLVCRIVWSGGPDLDAALLEIADGRRTQRVPVRWGQLVTGQAGVPCEAAGFPRAMAQEDGLRDLEQVRGSVNPGTGFLGRRLYLDVQGATPAPGAWAGMSGAAVWSGPLLIGVVAWEPEAFAAGRLAAEPATRLFEDPGFRDRVGGDAMPEAAELAGPGPRIVPPSPAYLLRADSRATRFRSRQRELADLTVWCEGSGVRVGLVTGPGGQGKTRLALELASRLQVAGDWVTAVLSEKDVLPAEVRKPLLVVLDYAETRLTQVRETVLAAYAAAQCVPVRVLLLARSAGDWLDRLVTESADLEMLLSGITLVELAPLEDTEEGAAQAFAEAVEDYGTALDQAGWPRARTVDAVASRHGSALALHMAALAALLNGEAPAQGLEPVILRHEARYWSRTARQGGLDLSDETLRRCVAATALCGVADEPEMLALLACVPGLRDQNEDVRLRAARWLRDLYPAPGADYACSLQPDLLAEQLTADVATDLRTFPAALLAPATERQRHRALTVLTRAATQRAELRGVLEDLFEELPGLAPQVVRVLVEAEYPDTLLRPLWGLVRRRRFPADVLAAVSDALPHHSQLLTKVALRVEERLVDLWEQRARQDPAAHERALALSLNNLAVRRTDAGQRGKAQEAAQRAVAILERLAQEDPDRCLPDLARALNNLSLALADLGRTQESLEAVQRAADTYEKLVALDPDTWQPDLAAALSNLSARLAAGSRHLDSVAAVRRAVAITERLADQDPARYLPDLASALNNLAVSLVEVGWHLYDYDFHPDFDVLVSAEPGKSAAIRRAVEIRERLMEVSPDSYALDLAVSLSNLSLIADGEEALEAITHAVELREWLAERFDDEGQRRALATALGQLSDLLQQADREAEAEEVFERAAAVGDWRTAGGLRPGVTGWAITADSLGRSRSRGGLLVPQPLRS